MVKVEMVWCSYCDRTHSGEDLYSEETDNLIRFFCRVARDKGYFGAEAIEVLALEKETTAVPYVCERCGKELAQNSPQVRLENGSLYCLPCGVKEIRSWVPVEKSA